MSLARRLIGEGRIPPPEAFVVEGIFSDHDLPLAGAPCEGVLCLRPALGVDHDPMEQLSGWLQVGMASNIDPASFEREPLLLIAVVDVSCSMGWGGGPETPGSVARELLKAVTSRLGSGDRFALVAFGRQVRVELEPTDATNQSMIQAAIQRLRENGQTNMEAGLNEGFRLARMEKAASKRRRVMLVTDVQPNVGATTALGFKKLVGDAANEGIGLSAFAVGTKIDQQVLAGITSMRDANAFGVFSRSDVPVLMEENWPWFVSPIAHDLRIEVAPHQGYVFGRSYGFTSGSIAETRQLAVPTVFLSRRRGALLLRLDPAGAALPDGLGASVTLSYTTPDGEVVRQTAAARYAGQALNARGEFHEQPSVAKTVALARLVSGMQSAVQQYQAAPFEALRQMVLVERRIREDARALNDAGLAAEAELAGKLTKLIAGGAPMAPLPD